MRTGTSMMMHALVTGGMDGVYTKNFGSKAREEWKARNYHPNKYGFYEARMGELHDLNVVDGKVAKLFGRMLLDNKQVYDCGVRIVYMTREFANIKASGALMRNKPPSNPSQKEIEYYNTEKDKIIKWLNNRKDILSIDVFDYDWVVDNPREAFELLQSHGWEFDIEKAIKAIDPDARHIGGK